MTEEPYSEAWYRKQIKYYQVELSEFGLENVIKMNTEMSQHLEGKYKLILQHFHLKKVYDAEFEKQKINDGWGDGNPKFKHWVKNNYSHVWENWCEQNKKYGVGK